MSFLFKISILLFLFACTTTKSLKLKKLANEPSNCTKIAALFLDSKNNFSNQRTQLKASLKKFSPTESQAILNAIDALHFIDYNLSLQKLEKLMKGKEQLHKTKFPWMFNNVQNIYVKAKNFILYLTGKDSTHKIGDGAFENFVQTRNWLYQDRPNYDIHNFKKAHSLLMSGGIENLDVKFIGEIRSHDIAGNISHKTGVAQKEYLNLIKNPYLGFRSLDDQVAKPGHFYGYILYPSIEFIKPEVINRLQKNYSTLLKEIEQYKLDKIGNKEGLTQKLISAMVEERLDWFMNQRQQLAVLDSTEKISTFIDLVSQLQRDIISIHPFRNGNGRVVREFILNYALYREGLPPSRIIEINFDLYSSHSEWKEIIIRGINSTFSLYQDLILRLNLGLKLEDSLDLYLPTILRFFTDINNSTQIEIDPRQFFSYLDQLLNKNENILEQIADSPSEGIKMIEFSFLAHLKNMFHLLKQQLYFIDRDFIHLFGEPTFKNLDVWKSKLNIWYHNQTVWRGFTNENTSIDEEQIIKIFTQLGPQSVSNTINVNFSPNKNQNQLRNEVIKTFADYNNHLYSDIDQISQLVDEYKLHGTLSSSSYGYLTTKNKNLAKKAKPQFIIGVKQAKKDFDLASFNRSDTLNDVVIGIGAIDPDSIMVLQVLNENNEVVTSYLRNPGKTWEIIAVEGEYNYFSEINKSSNILHTFDLH